MATAPFEPLPAGDRASLMTSLDPTLIISLDPTLIISLDPTLIMTRVTPERHSSSLVSGARPAAVIMSVGSGLVISDALSPAGSGSNGAVAVLP